MLFSRRKGYIKARDEIQVESLDESTKNRIWTFLIEHIFSRYRSPNLVVSHFKCNIVKN
jgi:hypothetical protein